MFLQPERAADATRIVLVGSEDGRPIDVGAADHIFAADFVRTGPDLVLQHAGHEDIRILDYFRQDTPPDLVTEAGAVLPGAWVVSLAGPQAPGQYAQVGIAGTGDVIGQVETVSGNATVQRTDGTQVSLGEGSNIYLGDVVATGRGADLAITFVDGTIFSLSSDSRMVVDELVYSPASSQNSAIFNLVQGSFVFIAGQLASEGEMEVNTPAATMGIRGTTVLARLQTNAGLDVSEISLTRDPGSGDIGEIELFDALGNLLAIVTRTDTKYIVTSAGQITEVLRTPDDDAADAALLEQLLAAFEEAALRVEQGGNFVEIGRSDPSRQQQGNQDDTSPDTDLDDQDSDPLPPAPDPLPEDLRQENDSDAPFDEGRLRIPLIDVTSVGTSGETLEVTSAPEDAQGSVFEDETTTTGGQLTASSEVVTWTGSAEGAFGVFEITPDGTWSYTIGAAAEALAEGQDVTETFVATVTSDTGLVASTEVVVAVTGANDAPEVTSTAIDAQGEVFEDEVTVVSGQLAATDADTGAVLTWSGTSEGTFGTFEIAADGAWTYRAGVALETLGVEESANESFTATVTDDQGATATQTVTITLFGSNDAPVITLEDPEIAAVVEADAPSASGQLVASDLDASARLTWTTEDAGAFGTFTLAEDGAWTYAAGPEADALAVDEVVFETFTVTVTDDAGASASETVQIRLTGTNTAPIVTSAPGEATAALDLALSDTASGQLAAIDVDGAPLPDDETGEFLRVSPFANTGTDLTWDAPATGDFGSFSISQTGAWTYTADNADQLAAGETATDRIEVTVSDALGATTMLEVTIDLTGANLPPELTSEADDATGTAIENTAATVSGRLSASDPEGSALSWSAPSPGAFGSFQIDQTGAWSYTADERAELLAEGEQALETFTVTVRDADGGSTTQDVEITVRGTNDLPEVETVPQLVSDGTQIAGQLEISDIDANDTPVAAVATDPENGSVTLEEDGAFTYTPDAEFSGTDRFTYTVTDDAGGSVSGSVDILVEEPLLGENDSRAVLSDQSVLDLSVSAQPTGSQPYGHTLATLTTATAVNAVLAIDASLPADEVLASLLFSLEETASLYAESDLAATLHVLLYGETTRVVSTEDLSAFDPNTVLDALAANPAATGDPETALLDAEMYLGEVGGDSANFVYIVSGEPLDLTASGDTPFELTPIVFIGPATSPSDPFASLEDRAFGDSTADPTPTSAEITLIADGVDEAVIADESDLDIRLDEDGASYALADIPGLADLLGDDNIFSIDATFVPFGDAETVSLSAREEISKADTAQNLTGTARSDLILGSDAADQIAAGAGDDIVLGFAGADTLNAGTGADTVKAGAGNDRIEVNTGLGMALDGGTGRDELAFDDAPAALDMIDLSGIEAIDLTNGKADTLSLSLSDILNISSEADTDLEALLDAILPDSMTVLGESGDTLDLDESFSETGQTVTDTDGNELAIFKASVGSDVLATLAVDVEVAVASQPVLI